MDAFSEALCMRYEQELGIPERVLCSIVEASDHDGSIAGLSPELAASFGVSNRSDAIYAAAYWLRCCIEVFGLNEFSLIAFYQGPAEALRKARVVIH